jgi:hypothetical protein
MHESNGTKLTILVAVTGPHVQLDDLLLLAWHCSDRTAAVFPHVLQYAEVTEHVPTTASTWVPPPLAA